MGFWVLPRSGCRDNTVIMDLAREEENTQEDGARSRKVRSLGADGKIGVCDTPAVFSNPGPHPLRGLHGIGCTTYLAARTVSLLYLRPPGRAGSPHFYEQSTDM